MRRPRDRSAPVAPPLGPSSRRSSCSSPWSRSRSRSSTLTRGMELPPPDRQHVSPKLARLPHCLCWRSGSRVSAAAKGGLDAETQELADGDSRTGAARGALCNPVVARQRFPGKDEAEERSAPSQASPWSRPSAGIEEQEGVRFDGEGRRTLDAVGDPHPEGASPSPQAVLRDARHRGEARRSFDDLTQSAPRARLHRHSRPNTGIMDAKTAGNARVRSPADSRRRRGADQA
jgi:hypothetical protein